MYVLTKWPSRNPWNLQFHHACYKQKLILSYYQYVHFTKYDYSGSTLIIYGKMDFLLVLEKAFSRETKRDGITSFPDFTAL